MPRACSDQGSECCWIQGAYANLSGGLGCILFFTKDGRDIYYSASKGLSTDLSANLSVETGVFDGMLKHALVHIQLQISSAPNLNTAQDSSKVAPPSTIKYGISCSLKFGVGAWKEMLEARAREVRSNEICSRTWVGFLALAQCQGCDGLTSMPLHKATVYFPA